MVNLFDVATKELSQDAFLRWLFENYDRDDQFRKIVVDFISFLTKGQQGGRDQIVLEPGDITELKTFAQVDDVDIAIDFYSEKFTGKRTIVIEDKTTSDEHNQLETYNDKIKKKWKYDNGMTSDECVYKVFYKTNLIYEEELDRYYKSIQNGIAMAKKMIRRNGKENVSVDFLKSTCGLSDKYIDKILSGDDISLLLKKRNN